MKRIPEIEKNLNNIQEKLDIGSTDWTKEEKMDIEKCYFEITKVSVGWGRTVDLGCTDCVMSAVNIIKNYQAVVSKAEAEGSEVSTIDDWTSSVKLIQAKAQELGFEFEKSVKTKDQKIEALQNHISQLEVEAEEDQEDILGMEYTMQQLIDIVKAKTGEEVLESDVSYEALLDYVKDLQKIEDESQNN